MFIVGRRNTRSAPPGFFIILLVESRVPYSRNLSAVGRSTKTPAKPLACGKPRKFWDSTYCMYSNFPQMTSAVFRIITAMSARSAEACRGIIDLRRSSVVRCAAASTARPHINNPQSTIHRIRTMMHDDVHQRKRSSLPSNNARPMVVNPLNHNIIIRHDLEYVVVDTALSC